MQEFVFIEKMCDLFNSNNLPRIGVVTIGIYF